MEVLNYGRSERVSLRRLLVLSVALAAIPACILLLLGRGHVVCLGGEAFMPSFTLRYADQDVAASAAQDLASGALASQALSKLSRGEARHWMSKGNVRVSAVVDNSHVHVDMRFAPWQRRRFYLWSGWLIGPDPESNARNERLVEAFETTLLQWQEDAD